MATKKAAKKSIEDIYPNSTKFSMENRVREIIEMYS